jgi:antitoxin ParD1/3/4
MFSLALIPHFQGAGQKYPNTCFHVMLNNAILHQLDANWRHIGGQTMGTVRKTITFTEQQDRWIKAKIAEGQFTNDSEYIRDLVRRDQERSAEIEVIRAALIEGEQGGVSTRSPDDIRKAVQERMRKNGRL